MQFALLIRASIWRLDSSYYHRAFLSELPASYEKILDGLFSSLELDPGIALIRVVTYPTEITSYLSFKTLIADMLFLPTVVWI